MRVELGAPVVLVPTVPSLWHIPAPVRYGKPFGRTPEGLALCGLVGETFIYASLVRRRRLCGVCAKRAPASHVGTADAT